MNTIIAPTDFSAVAENAVNYAAAMAQDIETSLTLFHVYQIPLSVTETPIILTSVDELRDSAKNQIELLKEKIAQQTGGKLKIYTEIAMGNVEDEVEELCDRIKPFAVVTGTTGASSVERKIFGSTTLKMIRRITYPVIAVPADAAYENGIEKIGMACDFSKVVESTPFAAIKKVVKAFDASFDVLNIDYQGKHFTQEKPLESLLFHNEMSELNPSYHFIESHEVEDGVNEFASNNALDMIITIPKKHTLLESIFKKSSTSELVFHSHIPVLCIHE